MKYNRKFEEWEDNAEWEGDGRQEAWEAATLAERERCAKIVESTNVGEHPSDVAQVIRRE